MLYNVLVSWRGGREVERKLSGWVDAGVAYMNYPANRLFAIRGEAAPFTRGPDLATDDGDANGVYFSGGLDYELKSALFGSRSTSIGIRGNYADVSSNTSASFVDPGPGTRFGWVALDNTGGFGTPDGETLTTSTRRVISSYTIDIPITLEYEHWSSGSLKVRFGPSYRNVQQESAVDGSITSTVSLNENLETDYLGATLGVAADFPVTSQLTASVDMAISLYGADTDYRGRYVSSGPTSISRNLEDSEFAYSIDLRLGLDYQFNQNTKVGMFVGINYLSYAPVVSYGSVPTDPDGGVLSLNDDNLLTVTGGLSVSIRF